MQEQINIRKAEMNKRLLEQKSEEEELQSMLEEYGQSYQKARETCQNLESELQKSEEKNREWQAKRAETLERMEQDNARYHREKSRLESLINIAERYDGYGNSIRRVMERKESEPGLLGVVADLIQVRHF